MSGCKAEGRSTKSSENLMFSISLDASKWIRVAKSKCGHVTYKAHRSAQPIPFYAFSQFMPSDIDMSMIFMPADASHSSPHTSNLGFGKGVYRCQDHESGISSLWNGLRGLHCFSM